MSTYTKAKEFIEDAKDKNTLYSGIREILSEDMAHYPEDWQIKRIQALADAKYQELSENLKKQVESLSDEALEMAYRKRQMQYLIQDAKNHTEDYLSTEYETAGLEVPNVPEAVYEAMAMEYLDRQDCNVPENSTWEGVVHDYLKDEAYAKTVILDENQAQQSVFTIVNGIEVDLRDYFDDEELISQLMHDESFVNDVSFGFEKEFAMADDDVPGNEILVKVVTEEMAKRTEANKLQNASQNTADNPVVKRKGR